MQEFTVRPMDRAMNNAWERTSPPSIPSVQPVALLSCQRVRAEVADADERLSAVRGRPSA